MTLSVPNELRAGALARQSLSELLGKLPRQIVEDVNLLVSELVANSVRHGGLSGDDHIEVSAQARRDCIRVEVCNPATSPPALASPEQIEGRESGWGLRLLDRIASRWGVDYNGRTNVWFEIDIAPKGKEGS